MQCSDPNYLTGGMICGDIADPLGSGIEGATITVEVSRFRFSQAVDSPVRSVWFVDWGQRTVWSLHGDGGLPLRQLIRVLR